MKKKKVNIVIIGAGRGGVSFLNLFAQDPLVKVLAVVDKNLRAPGIQLAKKLNIPTFTNWGKIIKHKKLDEIIDVTGRQKVFNTLLKQKPKKVGLIGGRAAKMIWFMLEAKKKIEEQNQRLILDLNRRIKELNCLFRLSRIIEKSKGSLEEIFEETIKVLAKSLQYPDQACARVVFGKSEFKCKRYRPTPWSLSAQININNTNVGLVEVCYLSQMPKLDIGPFAKEELDMLTAVAESLGAIIERQQMEQEIRNIAQEWDNTFNAMSDLVLLEDTEFTITKVNKAMADALNKRPKDIIGKKCYEVLHNRDKPWPECPFEKTRQDYQPHTEEVNDPNIGVPLLVTTSPLYNHKGEFVGSVHVAKDISRVKKSEEEIKLAKQELEIQTWGLKKTNEAIRVLYKELAEKTRRVQELDRLKSDFISTVSHELRTPLAITKEGISLVLDRIAGEINPKQEKLLVTARDNIDRLSRIINSLLDISKIEAGKLELKRDLVNLRDLINLTLSSFQQKASKKGLELKMNIPLGLNTEVYADADKIIQVFTNLVNNALKFTEKGGIEIKVEDQKKMLKCSVIDTGRGIAKQDLPKVFSKFQQFGRQAGAGEKGTGLGLSIAKGLAEMHHGQIWVESELNKGTSFIFTLPKYTMENIIEENLLASVEEAKKTGKPLSLIIISILDFEKVLESLSKTRIKNLVGRLKEQIQNSLRSAEDLVFASLNEMAIILRGCSKQDALSIGQRLTRKLEDFLNKQGLADTVKLKYGCATYPEDAAMAQDLINRIKQA